MKLTEYKGRTIEVTEGGWFFIDGMKYKFDNLAELKEDIDGLEEPKTVFPIDAISPNMEHVKITDINSKKVYFLSKNKDKRVISQFDYKGEPNFFANNEHNRASVIHYNIIDKELDRLDTLRCKLGNGLTEPIEFPEES